MFNIANVASSHDWNPWVPFGIGLGIFGIFILAVLAIVTIVLKGYALWHAAKRDEKGWFIVMLIINTMGILELVYLAFIVKKWKVPSEPNS